MSEKVPEKKKRVSGFKRIFQNGFFGSASSKDKKRHENSRFDGSKSKTKIVPGSCDGFNFNRNLMERHTIASNERNFYQNQHQNNVMYVNQHVIRPPISSSPIQQLPNMYFEEMNHPNLFDEKNCQHYNKTKNVYDIQKITKKENGIVRVNDMYGTVFDNLSPMPEPHERKQVQTSLKNGSDYGLVNSNRNMNFVRNSPERISIGPVGTYQNIVYQNQYFDMYENLQKNPNQVMPTITTGPNANDVRKSATADRRRFQRSHSFSSNESSSVDDETYRNYLFRKRNSTRKKVVINNKYCDMYGQIHETDRAVDGNQTLLVNDDNFVSENGNKADSDYGQIKKVGVIYGQINFKNVTNKDGDDNDDVTSLRSNESVVSATVNDEVKDEVDKANVLHRDTICDHDWKNDKTDQHVQNKVINTENNDTKVNKQRNVNNRRDEPRRHTLTGTGLQSHSNAAIIRAMDLESMKLRNGYLIPNNSAMFDDDPGIMSEVETSSTGFRRGNKQRSSLPVVRTPNKTLERPLGLVFLQYRNETKRALLPNEITSIDTVRALFVRSFPKQLTMEYLDSAMVKIYMHDSSKDMFFELEDSRIHLRDIKDRSVLRIFEANDVTGGLPRPGIGIAATLPHSDDPSYFSEPEFDSEFQHQHIHKSKIGMGKNMQPYYIGSSKTLPRNSTLFRTYSTNNTTERLKNPPNQSDGYMSSPERTPRSLYEDPYYSHYANRANTMTQVIDEEASDTEIVDESYALYGVKIGPGTTVSGATAVTSVNARNGPVPRALFPKMPYDSTRIKVEQMERQLANLTGLVQKALTQPQNLNASRDNFRDELDMNSNSSSTSAQDKSVSFEKSVSFSDEPPDEKSQKQHSPQHFMDTKPTKSAIKSSTLPRMSSQDKDHRMLSVPIQKPITYTSNHIIGPYRELQITPEIYNQLRCLQKKTKDIRYEMRNLRRLAQTQSHTVHEHIRDAFTKIRTMILVRGDDVLRSEIDQEKLRLSREEDVYKQEIQHLEKDLSDLELTVEELRTNVINRKTRVNMFDVENMALVLTRSSKTIAELKLRFPMLHDGIKMLLNCEMERIVHEEKFLKEEPDRLESALRRCKKLTGTLVTLKRLASVQEQRLPCQNNLLNDHMHLDNGPGHSPINHNNNKEFVANDNLGQIDENKEDSERQQSVGDNAQVGRQENALDALLDELQTFSKPNDNNNNHKVPEKSSGLVAEIGKKFDSTSGVINSDNNNNDTSSILIMKRIPPPPPPRTSSRSPIQSPTDDKKSLTETVVKDIDKSTLSQFEAAKQNLGLTTLKRGLVTKKAQTLPRNLTDVTTINLETKHQELLKKQKVLQDQYLKLQKTGSESNILQKVGFQFTAGNKDATCNQNKVYETDIL